jgi:hypothetical protein
VEVGDVVTCVNVYVPKVGTSADKMLLPGSGIVGIEGPSEDRRVAEGRVLVYFEGNKFGSSSFRTYADRVFHAADRMLWNNGRGYPTVALAEYDADDLLWVGTFTHPDGRLEIADSEKVAAWLGLDWLPDEEVVRSGR